MNCVDCKHFHILYEPIKHFDCGRAVCDKYDLIKDFMSHRELSRLECTDAAGHFAKDTNAPKQMTKGEQE